VITRFSDRIKSNIDKYRNHNGVSKGIQLDYGLKEINVEKERF